MIVNMSQDNFFKRLTTIKKAGLGFLIQRPVLIILIAQIYLRRLTISAIQIPSCRVVFL